MQYQLPKLKIQGGLSFTGMFLAFLCMVFGIKDNNLVNFKYTLIFISFALALISLLWGISIFKDMSAALTDTRNQLPNLNEEKKSIQRVDFETLIGIKKIWISRAHKSGIAVIAWFIVSTFGIGTAFPVHAEPLVFIVLNLVSINLAMALAFGYIPIRNQREYYSIPSSRNEHGHHKCIFCGNRGIYKHGQYKSNLTWHDCSKCGENLYIS